MENKQVIIDTLTRVGALERDPQLLEEVAKDAPGRHLGVRRVILGDSEAKRLSNGDPLVHLLWVGRDGVKCETVLVGGIARLIRRVLESAGLPEGASCFGSCIRVVEFLLFRPGAFDASDGYVEVSEPSKVQRVVDIGTQWWEKVTKRRAH